MTTERRIACERWEKLEFKPYLWGGDDFAGLDCSGLAIEGLKAAGVLQRSGDWTAHTLASMFPQIAGAPKRGDLLFWDWNKDGKIDHVEIVWEVDGPKVWTLGAAAGGSSTTSIDAASKQNAYVMVRPARPNWAKAVDPFAG